MGLRKPLLLWENGRRCSWWCWGECLLLQHTGCPVYLLKIFLFRTRDVTAGCLAFLTVPFTGNGKEAKMLLICCPKCHWLWSTYKQNEAEVPLLFLVWKKWLTESVNMYLLILLFSYFYIKHKYSGRKILLRKWERKEMENKPNLDFACRIIDKSRSFPGFKTAT